MQRIVTYLTPLFLFCLFASKTYAKIEFSGKWESYLSYEGTNFIQDFPYQNFLAQIPLSEINSVEWFREELFLAGLPSDDWLFELGASWMAMDTIDSNALNKIADRIRLGDHLMNVPTVLGPSAGIYEAVGDMLLEDVADYLEETIQAGDLSKKDPEVKYLVMRLEESGYIIDLPLSSFEKVVINAKEGRWDYIWSRVKARYFPQFITAMIMMTSLLVLLIVSIRSKRKKKQEFTSLTNISKPKQKTYEPI